MASTSTSGPRLLEGVMMMMMKSKKLCDYKIFGNSIFTHGDGYVQAGSTKLVSDFSYAKKYT